MVIITGDGEGWLQVEGREHQHQIFPWPHGIGMLLEVLLEADGGELLEIRPSREHAGAQEAGVALIRLVDKEQIGSITT
jgi:hypothetical protein